MIIVVIGCLCLTSAGRAAADQIYWSNLSGNTLAHAGLDGSNAAAVNTGSTGVSAPYGMAFDLAANKIYWVNQNSGISWTTFDGSIGGILNTSGTTGAPSGGLAIWPARGRLYYPEQGGHLAWAALDGTGGGEFDVSTVPSGNFTGVTIDPAANRIYWGDTTDQTIDYTSLDGSGTAAVLLYTAGGLGSPTGIAIDPLTAKIYWANQSAGTIGSANLDGTAVATVSDTGVTLDDPTGVSIDPAAGLIYTANYLGANYAAELARLSVAGGGAPIHVPTAQGPVAPVLLRTPKNKTRPVVSGNAYTRSILSCSQGDWAGDVLSSFLYHRPTGFSYQWLKGGQEIIGADASTYVPTTAGAYQCQVKAGNQAGDANAISRVVKVMAPPVTKTPPTRASIIVKHLRVHPSRFKTTRAALLRTRPKAWFWVSSPMTVNFTLRRLSQRGGPRYLTASLNLPRAGSQMVPLNKLFPRQVSKLRGRYRLYVVSVGDASVRAQNSFRPHR